MEDIILLKSQGFEVLRTLGTGASARVYLVSHNQFGIVAAKVMRNEDFNEKEWDAAGVFDKDPPNIRPFIIQNIAAQKFETHTILLIQYANLGSLFDLIKTDVDFHIPYIRAIMNQLLEGLRYIHSKGLIHRDIKGGNILMYNPSGSGRVIFKIADFGEAKIKAQSDQSQEITIVGTNAYMAPEFTLGDGQGKVQADAKVDIWSLGILLFKILSHKFPFGAPLIQNIYPFMVNKVLIRPHIIKDDILWDLLQQMLQFDRNKRISAAEALQHPFFTGEQAIREIQYEQYQLAQFAQYSQRGDQTITQFDINPLFIFPLSEINKFKKKNKEEKPNKKEQKNKKKKRELKKEQENQKINQQ
ncbi:MAG: putative CAMK family protein kinase [Streblomastix strix]|uniref:Putative CAMK family protein kinase n=1 Tax=Streblomastix strix TaxID=222440 RepID=A0A5J4U974_9EUKA|nr:MAG: putative CAMK family protein kinase [Streblomastix strix]